MSAKLLMYIAVLAAWQLVAAAPSPVVLDDFGKLNEVGEPVLSVDGSLVAYTLGKRIYVVPANGGEPRPLTSDLSTAHSPLWSLDGAALYFLSDRSGSSQLWRLPVATFGEAGQESDIEGGVEALNFSPDQTALLLEREEPAPPADDADDVPPPWVITRKQFKEDAGDGYLTSTSARHLYRYDLATAELRQVVSGDYSEGEAAWSPDGRQLVFVSNREADPDDSYRRDLWLANVDSETVKLTRLSNDEQVRSSPAWSPDGRFIAYLIAVDGVYGTSQLALVPAGGGEARILTAALDRWVTDFQFAADGRSIYFTYENHGGTHLAQVRLRDQRIETLLEGDRVVSGFDVDSRGRITVRMHGANDGSDLYALDGRRTVRLTDVNREFFASTVLGEKSKVTYTVADGTEVEAFVTRPADFDSERRYPVILSIHGGPVGQFTWGYDFSSQFLAAAGYVVVEPNPRGSNGRGQAFTNAIHSTWGITDYPDVIGAVDHVIESGLGDPDRIFVTGYSYGGYMTNVVITETDRFKAAMSGAGHSFIAANFGHDIYQKWYSWELGLPVSNRDKYDRLSPLLRAEKVTTPTLFAGGRDDWNVPVLNAELFYQALRRRGIDTELVVYPDSHHGDWDESYSKDYLARMLDWFGRHDVTR